MLKVREIKILNVIEALKKKGVQVLDIQWEPGWYTIYTGPFEMSVRDEIIDKWKLEKAIEYILDNL